jgi:hypothetical protein
LDGLSSLLSVGVNLQIRENDVLTTVNGLSSLTSVGAGMTISDNPLLCISSVWALLAACTVGGSVQNLTGNDPGC